MAKPISIRKARAALSGPDEDKRAAVVGELEALGAAEITDVLSWDAEGNVLFYSSSDLDPRARKAIKKVKVTPGRFGNQVEVEMHDKISSLRLLAKHHGLLETDSGVNRPSMIGINLTGPEVASYRVLENDEATLDSTGDSETEDGTAIDES